MEESNIIINSVKKSKYGYVINESLHVPNDSKNSDYQAVQKWIDAGNTPADQHTPEEAAQIESDKIKEAAKAELLKVDLESIRSIREYIAAQPDAPKILKDKEAAAVLEREKLK